MLVHLSNTSPFVCDLNRGPIEQANRMASAPTKKATALLENKESFPKQTRTPLKLLAPGEVPMDTTAIATDINASLQPIWYTEQTIVDEYHVQQEDIASIIQEQQQGKSLLPRTTLPTIQSESPSITEEIEELPNQSSLMHKSSTFTIEQSMHVDSPLNDSEKENVIKEDTTNQIIPPSDDSFRALEELLGLGSTGTVRDSPKTNHDTLSLTVVTPTDIINSTRRSSRISYAPKGGSDSLPSSQDIPTMPTIESISSAEPPSFLADNTAMNQQTSFDLTENDTIKDDSNNDDETNFSFELNDFPNDSKNESMVTVPETAPPMITIRAPTCADVAYRALIKPRVGGRVSQPIKADSPLAKTNKLRSSAPTSRMLRSSCRRISTDAPSQNSINQEQPLSSNPECFVNDTELIEVVSLPEEDEVEQEKTTSITLNMTSSKETEDINQNASIQSEQISTPTKPIMPILSREYTYDTPKRRTSQRHRSMLTPSYATPMQSEQTTINEEATNSPAIASKSMLNILLTKPTEAEPRGSGKRSIAPSSIRTSTPVVINEGTTSSPSIASKSMLNILLTQPTEAETKGLGRRSIAPSSARTSRRTVMNETAPNSPSIASKSMLNILLTQPTEAASSAVQQTPPARMSRRTITNKEAPNSPLIASKSMLEVLLTKPTETESSVVQQPSPARMSRRTVINEEATNSPSIASKSMLEILSTKPTEGESSVVQQTSIASSPGRTSTRKSGRVSSNPTPRASINPLHSSTPSSTRHKSLQMVSIGEQEQVSTTVPQQINIEIQEEEEEDFVMVSLNDIEESIQQQPSTIEIGIQTTPSLDISSRRRLNTIHQQATPIVQMNKSSSIVIADEQQQITSLQTNYIMNLQRSVRFQLTPDTDARLVAKEIFEENLRGLKPDIVINPIPVVPVIKQEKVKMVPIKKITKAKTKVLAAKKKKAALTKKTQPKPQPIEKKTRQPQKAKTIKQQKATPSKKDSKKKPEVTPPNKPASRKRTIPSAKTKRTPSKRRTPEAKITPVVKRVPSKRKISESTTQPAAKRTISEVTAEPIAKRAARNRTIPEAVVEPIAKRVPQKRTTAEPTIEPVAKRAKTSKSVEVKKQPIEVPLPPSNLPKTRSRSTNNKKIVSPPRTKTVPPKIKTSKRRLQSVEKPEVEEKKIQSIPVVQKQPELTQEERQKIEALTVAGLKSRLNTHKEDIPKGAKKADLIALLIKIETNLLKDRKETATVHTTTMTTRRRHKQ